MGSMTTLDKAPLKPPLTYMKLLGVPYQSCVCSQNTQQYFHRQLTDILIQRRSVDIREVLEDDTGRSEWNLHSLGLGLLPVEDTFHIGGLHQKPITVADG